MKMKLIRRFLLFILTQLGIVLVTATAAPGEEYFRRPGPTIKEWRGNTNFDNLNNWQGLQGYENCSKNIYSFPPWYDQENVVALPEVFTGQQIILPVNGHFVFRDGINKFLNVREDTCRAREVKFIESQADWLEPERWYSASPTDNEKRDSLLNAKLGSKAVAHVERVPCQYDSVRFPVNKTFNLRISENVTISRFYLGKKAQSYTDVALLMNSPLGKLQFRKAPETIFSITDNGSDEQSRANNNNNKNSGEAQRSCQDETGDGDSDLCICSNYMDRRAKQKICSLTNCDTEAESTEESCPNPVTPHGFCCPICGFHVKIRHSGRLRLIPLYGKLREAVAQHSLQRKVHAHLTRYKEKAAHLLIAPGDRDASAQVLGQIARLVTELEGIIKREAEVTQVTVIESWGGVYPSGGSTDRLEGGSVGAGTITLLVLLGIVAVAGGIAIALFMWNKKHGYPPLSLSGMTSSLPRVSMGSIRIPIVPGAGRRSSTLSSSLHNFGFARFTNERVSTITIGPQAEGASRLQKSSSIRRAEEVDDQVPEKVSDAKSGAFGFTNVTYDLVAGVGEQKVDNKEEGSKPATEGDKAAVEIPTSLLQIPEIKIKDVDEPPIIQEKKLDPIPGTSGPPPPKPRKREDDGKGKLPGFVASRIAKAYQKLGPDELVDDPKEDKPEEPVAVEKHMKESESGQEASASGLPVVAEEQQTPGVGSVETLVNLEE